MKIKSKHCPVCNSFTEFNITEEEYQKYIQGDHIQDCFPSMPADQRERLVSGYCPACWNEIFKEEDDFEVDDFIEEDVMGPIGDK